MVPSEISLRPIEKKIQPNQRKESHMYRSKRITSGAAYTC